MRPDHERDSFAEDAPAWERDPVVAQALRDAMTVKTGGLSWKEALSLVLARQGRQPREMRSRPRKFFAGTNLNWRVRTMRRVMWPGVTIIAIALVVLFGWPHSSSNSSVTQAYTTTMGQRAAVTLGDGTRMTLAPQTTVRLVHYGPQSRTVLLDSGEAYFEATNAAGAPFIVRSGAVTARVLGTGFVVRHYAGGLHTRVSVTTGKVAVSTDYSRSAGVALSAGYVGDVVDSTITVKTGNDATSDVQWVDGALLFHDTPVSEVLATLSRWYGYQFRCADLTVTQQPVTIALSAKSSAEALYVLEQVLNVDLTVAGDTVTLAPRAVQPVHGNSRIQTYDLWIPANENGK